MEKTGEKKLKVGYMSDGDIKGSIPGFVKKMVAEMQGEVASRIDKCLKKLRSEKNKWSINRNRMKILLNHFFCISDGYQANFV